MLAFSNTAPVPTLCGKYVRMNKGVLNCGIKRREEVQWVNCFLQPPFSFKGSVEVRLQSWSINQSAYKRVGDTIFLKPLDIKN